MAIEAITYPPELPVSARREDLLAAIGEHQVVVVAGETGSGKTTQLPKLCLELGRGADGRMIAHTQPRRIAARAVAERIAAELGVAVGEEVGYAVRFSDRSTDRTRVRVMTDGLLLAELRRDRMLRRYDTIVVDEAHERSLNVDFLLGAIHRILPRRPDLKLVITSATIDPERFSAHFGGAPIVEVSGRTYPVDVRYAPPDDLEHDQAEAIAGAVEQLLAERRDDVLVFLSGEREIRDTADVLAGRLGPRVEILPLYARLASGAQRRVFRAHPGPRVVLATNVAETSLTVPGIRSVVDPGTARISRYSARLKVQRLPIEPISRASADQRAGRCGRVAPGVCIRLYAEEDLAGRPRFTDPEILRTSLAAVILQMAAAGLGDVEAFPFMDPPDRRQVRDGVRLLQELAALDRRGRITKLGRALAHLPVDPRMGRMVLEADRRDCATEVAVIAAALSIQDPRERPPDRAEQADQLHARFAGEGSDFLALLRLWEHLRARQEELSGSAFRRLCRDEYLHPLRVREWQDLVAQLRRAGKQAGVRFNSGPAGPDDVHVALLAGLLSHIGVRDADGREFHGARNARFRIFPGSVLARRPTAWVMVAELVETTRLWGRTAAPIRPEWAEPLAAHLVRRRYDEPRWVRERASVVATERVTLYGLPIVAGRTVAYGRIDPPLARALFIRRALVEGEWDARHAFREENARRVEEVRALEDRLRRRDLLATDETLFAFFDARVPPDVVSGGHFDRWWRDERRRDPDALTLPWDVLVPSDAGLDREGLPDTWDGGLALSYRFEPGSPHDGVTVHVPLDALAGLRPEPFAWLVPALREELMTALIRSLPKAVRRVLVPAPEVAREVARRLDPSAGDLLAAVATELGRVRGVRVAPSAFDLSRLPAHLRMTFRVQDGDGAVLAEGEDLDALRAEVRPQLRARLAAAAARFERHGMRAWEAGEIPRAVSLPGTGGAVRAYPALVDEGASVGVAVLDTPEAQRASMRAGTRRLLRLTVPSPMRRLADRLGTSARLALSTAPHESADALLDDVLDAALDALVARAGGPARDAAGFARLRGQVAGGLELAAGEALDHVIAILDLAREVRERLDALTSVALQPARADVAAQLRRLVRPGFATATGVERLPDVERYLRAALRRLDRLPNAPAPDRDRMSAVHELERAYRRALEAWPRGRPVPEPLRELPWMLEELRVSQFAQALGTRGPASSTRIRRVLDEVASP